MADHLVYSNSIMQFKFNYYLNNSTNDHMILPVDDKAKSNFLNIDGNRNAAISHKTQVPTDV
jgi:hypothetical protein